MGEESKTYAKDLDVVWELIGRKPRNPHIQNIQFEVKQDRLELRLLVADDCRLFVIRTKPPKLEYSIHYADVTEIHCNDFSKLLAVTAEGRQLRMAPCGNETFKDLLFHIFERYSSISHSLPMHKRFPKLDAGDEIKKELVGGSMHLVTSQPYLIGPCGNFSSMYRWKCDQMGAECHDEVAWDVSAIYNSQNCYELNLSDFDHLSPKSMIPILASLECNNWFTKLNLSNTKMTADLQNELLKVLKENSTIEEVNLSNTGIKSEFLSRLFAIQGCSVSSFDLSNNNLDDKGLHHLCTFINGRHEGLKSLNLSRTSVTSSGVNALGRVLCSKQRNLLTLEVLDLSGNSLKEELVALQNFLAHPNRLRILKLADTETPLENFFAASLRGSTQHLEVLDLSGCQLGPGGKKGGPVPQSWKQFFSSVSSLQLLNFSNNKFTPDAYRMIFEGLEENTVVANIELNFSGCQIGLSPASVQVFEQHVGRMSKVSALDLSDNGFDQSICGIISSLVQNKHLKKLSVGRNLANVKTKFLHQFTDALVALMQEDSSALRSLSLDGLKLKGDLMDFIDALGFNNSLTHLDISGNMIGDVGAKLLSKALQLNRTLTSVTLDNNQLSSTGLEYIAASLEKNTSLKVLPVPLNDLITAMKLNPERTEKALRKMEQCTHRNSSSRVPDDMGPAYRLQQWIFNLDHDELNRHVRNLSQTMSLINDFRYSGTTKIDDSVEEKLKGCERILEEAKNVKNVLSELHKLSTGSFQQGSLVQEVSKVFVDKTKEFTEQLKSYMSQNYQHSLKAFSQQSRYDPSLTSREEARLEREVQGSTLVLAGHLLGPLSLEKSAKFTEFITSTVALSLEFALVNAKSILLKLSSGEDQVSNPVVVRSPTIDVGDEAKRLSKDEKRTEGWKNRMRPSSSIVSPVQLQQGHIPKVGTNSSWLLVGPSLETLEVQTPIPKPRNKKKKTIQERDKSVDHDTKTKGEPNTGKARNTSSQNSLDVTIPSLALFEDPTSGRDKKSKLPSFFPLNSDVMRKPLLGSLTKSISHDELDERVERSSSMVRKKSLSRDALEDVMPCHPGSKVARGPEARGDRLDGAKYSSPDMKENNTANSNPSIVESPPLQLIMDADADLTPPTPLGDLEVPTQKLTHLCKDRPKRPKNKVPTRPITNYDELKDWQEVMGEDGGVPPRKDSEGTGGAEGVSDGVAEGDGIVRKELKKGGIAEGLKSMFAKKRLSSEVLSSSPDSPPTLPEQHPLCLKIVVESKPQGDSKVTSSSKSLAPKERDARKRRITEGSTLESSEVKPAINRGSAGHILSTPVNTCETTGVTGTASAPSVVKRLLPPGAKPGLGPGGFAMPSANEIQQKRLSMRPVSENLGLSEHSNDKKASTNNNSEVNSESQQAKVKPPPPLAPKPVKSFRDSRRESDVSITSPIIISDDFTQNPVESSIKSKKKEEEQPKQATFMEEFRKKQEKNKPLETPKP